MLDFNSLIEIKKTLNHKKNKHEKDSMHYWRYSGKIEMINELMDILGRDIPFDLEDESGR